MRIPQEQRRQRGPERIYTAEEIRKIITAADSLKFTVAFALLTLGTRREEVVAFTWNDVAADWSAVHVQRAVTLALGPGETKRTPR